MTSRDATLGKIVRGIAKGVRDRGGRYAVTFMGPAEKWCVELHPMEADMNRRKADEVVAQKLKSLDTLREELGE